MWERISNLFGNNNEGSNRIPDLTLDPAIRAPISLSLLPMSKPYHFDSIGFQRGLDAQHALDQDELYKFIEPTKARVLHGFNPALAKQAKNNIDSDEPFIGLKSLGY